MLYVERLPGGKAAGMRPSDFDPIQLCRGLAVELEHTNDPRVALEIAMDHLAEDPLYYVKLATIHVDGVRAVRLAPALGDARSEIINTLSLVMGQQQAEQLFKGFEALIEEKARKGAVSGARPWIIAGLALGGVGAILGTVSFLRLRQMQRRCR